MKLHHKQIPGVASTVEHEVQTGSGSGRGHWECGCRHNKDHLFAVMQNWDQTQV